MAETITPVSQPSSADCWNLLNNNEFGRLALSVSNQPEIFPINYTVQDGTLLFRTAPGTKLAALTVNESVAVEIDGHDDEGGWSVVVKGQAHVAEWGVDLEAAQIAGLRPWLATHKPVFVRVQPLSVTGRTFVFGPEPEVP